MPATETPTTIQPPKARRFPHLTVDNVVAVQAVRDADVTTYDVLLDGVKVGQVRKGVRHWDRRSGRVIVARGSAPCWKNSADVRSSYDSRAHAAFQVADDHARDAQ